MSTGSRRSSRSPSATALGASPTLRRWELATRLRELRLAAGRSVDEVAAELMCSAAKISRMETAGRGVQARDIRDLVRYYDLDASMRDELMRLAEEAKKPGWWQEYRTLSQGITHLIGLEASASEVKTLDALLIPALLQTREYTTTLLRGIRPPGELSSEQFDEWVEVKQQRQRLLADPDFRFNSIIDEAALARVVGSRGVMTRQIERLLDAASMPSVRVQLVPFERGSYPALEGAFQWMRFRSGQIGDLAFIEGLLGAYVLDKPADVARYHEIYGYIAEHVALSPEETVDWLRRQLSRRG